MSAVAASCNVSDVSSTTACIGPVTSPKVDSESWFNTYGATGAFDIDHWVFAEKIQNGDGTGIPIRETMIDVGLNVTPDVDGEQVFGNWSLDGDIFDQYLSVALVLKSGPKFSTYLLDGTSTLGTWDIQGWSSNGLSHISVYVVQAVPIPAAIWLFVSGLFALVALNRRRAEV